MPSLAELGAQALVEEPAEEQDCSDREERESTLHRAQAREVIEEDLAEADGEEDEPADAQQTSASLEPHVQRGECEQAPEGTHDRVATLKVRVHALVRDELHRFQDRQRGGVDRQTASDPDGLQAIALVPLE